VDLTFRVLGRLLG